MKQQTIVDFLLIVSLTHLLRCIQICFLSVWPWPKSSVQTSRWRWREETEPSSSPRVWRTCSELRLTSLLNALVWRAASRPQSMWVTYDYYAEWLDDALDILMFHPLIFCPIRPHAQEAWWCWWVSAQRWPRSLWSTLLWERWTSGESSVTATRKKMKHPPCCVNEKLQTESDI